MWDHAMMGDPDELVIGWIDVDKHHEVLATNRVGEVLAQAVVVEA